jgi:N-sulfoglucosamine sulfohydrolase
MRSIVTRRFAYIFNAWSNGRTVFKNESQSGRTMKAMRQAAEGDPHIAARVRDFLYRTPEEFYDYAQDPAALRNLIGESRYASEIQELREILLREMRATNDPQLKAFHPK